MIVKSVVGNVFETELKHIAFVTQTDGDNPILFSPGHIKTKCLEDFWPEIKRVDGVYALGQVLEKVHKNVTYHALICHPADKKEIPGIIEKCLEAITTNDEIALVLDGEDLRYYYHVQIEELLKHIHRSSKRVYTYTLWSWNDYQAPSN